MSPDAEHALWQSYDCRLGSDPWYIHYRRTGESPWWIYLVQLRRGLSDAMRHARQAKRGGARRLVRHHVRTARHLNRELRGVGRLDGYRWDIDLHMAHGHLGRARDAKRCGWLREMREAVASARLYVRLFNKRRRRMARPGATSGVDGRSAGRVKRTAANRETGG